MEKFQEINEKVIELNRQLRPECEKYLRNRLAKEEDASLDLLNYDEDGIIEDGDYVYVTYDGGRHPEYDTNVFNLVKGVFLGENRSVFLDTEDCDKYDIDRLDTSELAAVCEYVETYFHKD